MAMAGASVRQIGTALGISFKQAHRDIVGELERLNGLTRDQAVDYRRLQHERLESLRRRRAKRATHYAREGGLGGR
jgi:hypothetical protein